MARLSKKLSICFLGIVLASLRVAALDYELVADANTARVLGSSSPSEFVELNGTYFFRATTPLDGWQIWRTDLSLEGTGPITFGAEGHDVRNLTVLGDQLIYTSRAELLRSNGEPEGSEPIATLPGVILGDPVEFSGWLWFAVERFDNEFTELWRTDGRSAEMVLVAEIEFGTGDLGFKALSSQMLFSWWDEETGLEVWRTDGTLEGMGIFADLAPGPKWSYPAPWRGAAAGDTLLFSANGMLFRTDGTVEGTSSILDSGSGDRMVSIGGETFFSSNNSLWIVATSDGVPRKVEVTGLHLVRELAAPLGSGVLVFGSDIGERNGLWFSDGTTEGSRRLLSWSQRSNTFALPAGTAALVGIGDDERSPLYLTDGTIAGTVPVGPDSGDLGIEATSIDRVALFSFDRGNTGIEPWVSDGTPGGTRLISNVAPDDNTGGTSPSELTWVEDSIFFQSGSNAERTWRWSEQLGVELMYERNQSRRTSAHVESFGGYAIIRDGRSLLRIPPEGPAEVIEGSAFNPPGGMKPQPDKLLYLSGSSAYATDGTPNAGIRIGPAYFLSRSVVSFDALTFYVAEASEFGEEVWITDGTEAGTMVLEDLAEGPTASRPFGLTRIAAGVLFGTTIDGVWTLRYSDGTPDQTLSLLEIELTGGNGPNALLSTGGGAYFFVEHTLWWTDGSRAGTLPVRSFEEDSYLRVERPREWRVNGTALDKIGDGRTAVMSISTPSSGLELWKSDGTAAGTELLLDISPGERSSDPRFFVSDGRVAYFTANEFSTGTEIYRTDGTRDGTLPIGDFRPGRLNGRISELSIRDGYLYFVGDDGRSGSEIWRVALGPCPGDCDQDGRVTIAELVRAVGVALGRADARACVAVDRNSDNDVSISELVAAVVASLTGC